MKIRFLALITVIVSACGDAAVEVASGERQGELNASVVTEPTVSGALVNAALWRSPGAPGDSLVLGAAGIGGLELYRPDGERVGIVSGLEAGLVVVVDDVTLGGRAEPVVVVYDYNDSALKAFRLQRDSLQLQDVMPEPLRIDDEVVGLCHYRSRLSGSDYLYAVTDGGLTLHFELYARGARRLGGRLLRTVPTGKDTGFCAVDPRDGMLYISEEEMGIWRLGAEPESDTVRQPVDLRTPWGKLSDDLKGVGVYPVDTGTSYLIVADPGHEHLAVYRLPDLERLGAVAIEGLSEAEGIIASNAPFGEFAQGLIVIADEDASDGGTDLKLVAWPLIADALGLEIGGASAVVQAAVNTVRPVGETEPVDSFGDAADDPAIWVHRDDPSRSLVIGTDKKRGLNVYDLDGRTVQKLPDGRLNNVDLRYDFPLAGEEVALVAASNRSTAGISLYRIDADALQLVETADGILPTGFDDPYGLCMYRSAASGDYFVFISENDDGLFRQWRLFDNGNGKVSAEQVREFPVGSKAEGCAADDETGFLYVGEEDRGLWKYPAEPDGGSDRVLIDSTGDEGRLDADVEGVAIWAGANGRGYIVASNQGADNYAVYRREGDNEYVGHFHIVANAGLGIDGASETDGLEVTSATLGPRFPAGLLVVQDGRNIAPETRQNFKYVSWEDVAKALGLD